MGSLTADNSSIADALERYALLLDASGSSPYAVRAYRRAAELIRPLPVPVAELVRSGRVRELPGIGASLEARLSELVTTGELAHARALEEDLAPKLEVRLRRQIAGGGPPRSERVLLLSHARTVTESIAEQLDAVVAGDARRWSDDCHRLAVVARSPDALARFAALPQIITTLDRGDSRVIGITVDGVPIELVVAPPERFGTELLRTTGSDAFVESLGPLPAAEDEEALFAALGLPFVPPELREEPLARGTAVPSLVELDQIRGDLHVHTTWSDGRASVLEMAEAARALGYEYLAVCDHTRNVTVVPGLDADEVRRQGEEIARVNEALAPFRVLRGIECDILPDGSLDLPDDVLVELDWVQASVHAGQRASAEEMTARVVEALRHPSVSCLSHPKGRIIGRRPENALDLVRTFEVALEEGKAVEVNGLPSRLDLRDVHVRLAIEGGVPIVCSTDAHSVAGLANMQLAVATARRGGAGMKNVLNTRPLGELP
jgi:DNA polymerase (family 10)